MDVHRAIRRQTTRRGFIYAQTRPFFGQRSIIVAPFTFEEDTRPRVFSITTFPILFINQLGISRLKLQAGRANDTVTSFHTLFVSHPSIVWSRRRARSSSQFFPSVSLVSDRLLFWINRNRKRSLFLREARRWTTSTVVCLRPATSNRFCLPCMKFNRIYGNSLLQVLVPAAFYLASGQNIPFQI